MTPLKTYGAMLSFGINATLLIILLTLSFLSNGYCDSSWILNSIGAGEVVPEVVQPSPSQITHTSAEPVLVPEVLPVTAPESEICGDILEDGTFEPCDKSVKRTYNFPDISVGVIFDIASLKPEPVIMIELFDVRNIKSDIGASYAGTFISLGYRLTSMIEITPFIFGGVRIPDIKPTYGVGISLTKF